MDPNTQRLLFGAAGAAGGDSKTYIEDLFSSFLYTGNGSSQTINNGIDLAGKGGVVWIKSRTNAYSSRISGDGANNGALITNATDAKLTGPDASLNWQYTSNGFNILSTAEGVVNGNGSNFVSWTFRKAAKFFDVVTAVADGNGRVSFNHSLGVNPGCVFVKRTDGVSTWWVYHRSLGGDSNLRLNGTNSVDTSYPQIFLSDSTNFVFTLGVSGATYVAYLFAHDTTADGMIQCGSFTTDGSGNATVSLGWESQWILVKRSDSTGAWFLLDTLRGWVNPANNSYLQAQSNAAETTGWASGGYPTSTGFYANLAASATYIYIAIRRGPMKTPTSGASVFNAVSYVGTGTNSRIYTGAGFPSDAILINDRQRVAAFSVFVSRITGGSSYLTTHASTAEQTGGFYYASALDSMDGYTGGTSDWNQLNSTNLTLVDYYLRRAPGFFDVVAGTSQSIADQRFLHNLSVPPELIIHKSRSEGSASTGRWCVYASSLGISKNVYLDNGAAFTAVIWGNSSPTASDFGFSTNQLYSAGATLIFYLFASCPGVSKVGSYTGTGTTLQINCGFTNGARFVLIKRVDAAGDWYVWDTARGIVAANEPYLLLNSSAAEVTNTDYIDPYAAGFEISSTAPAAINANGGSFIYLAIS